MEIQSNTAASLFDGLNQSQTQGTGAKDDAFSKMMERLLSDTANRKRDQADAEAAKSAADRSTAAKDAAREAREAREAKAEAQRKTPVRAERPRLDTTPPPRETEEPKPQASADAPAAREPVEDKAPAKTDEPARKPAAAKTDKPAAKDQAKDAAKPASDTAETAAPDADTETAALATDESLEESEAGGADGEAKDDAPAEGEATIIDLTPTVTETTVQAVTPTSDALLASLALTAAAQTTPATVTDPAVTAPTDTATATAQPAADAAAAQLAQAQQTATQATGPNASQAAGKTATDAAAVPADGTVPADATAEAGQATEALPTDEDAAVPTSFADLIAAAKAKAGEKSGAKQTGAESDGRNDGQPQPQTRTVASAQTPPTPGPALEALKSAANGQAIGTLAAAGPVAEAGATAQTSGSHTHAALAAMETPRAPAGVDATQTAAVMRPSRGTAGMPLGVPDQVAVHIKKNVASDVDQFTINLHPAELGRIDIKLDIGADGRVSAMVAVEKAQTLELLQKDSRGLERALQDAGLQADSNSLNFSLRGEGNPFQGENKGGGSGKRGRGPGSGTEVDPADGAAYTVTVGNGRLDIHA